MGQVILFVVLLTASVVLLVTAISFSIAYLASARTADRRVRRGRRARTSALLFCGCAVALAGLVAWSQSAAHTPPILDEHGAPLEGSIAELSSIQINGRDEWVSIRGVDETKPLLLFLAGGPGGSQVAAVRHDLAELERHFTVAVWEQPGSAKSFRADLVSDISPSVYVEDGISVTEYLLERFGQDKLYLVGESWGSALGVLMAEQAPDLFHALVGTGQMVDFLETELIDYELACDLARERGDYDTASKIESNGPPPYYGSDVTWKSADYLNYLSSIMASNPDIQHAGYNTFRDLLSPEYGLLDKFNYLYGLATTFNHVYPQLYEVDLRQDAPALDVPVYFFEGVHDINAPLALAEEYLEALEAPHKEIVWFEHSGHSPWINESSKFVDELVKVKGRAEQAAS